MEVRNTFAEYTYVYTIDIYSQLYVHTKRSKAKYLNLPINSMTTKQVHWHIQYNHSSRESSPILKKYLNTICALTFTGLNFRGFCGSAAIHESLSPWKFRPVCICKAIASQKCKNGGDLLGQLDMQLRTSTKAIDYINMTRI